MQMLTLVQDETRQATRVREFVVADLDVAAHFWDPLMAFLGWKRVDDGIGAVVYEGGTSAVLFLSGEPWDQAGNEHQRVSAFAHMAFDVQTPEELTSLAESLRTRAATEVRALRRVLDGGRWWWVLDFCDPNGLDVEVRCPVP